MTVHVGEAGREMVLSHHRARSLVVAVHLAFASVAPVFTVWGPDVRWDDARLAAPLAAVLFAIQLEHSLAVSQMRRPRVWPWTFVVLCAAVYLPLTRFSLNWASTQWFVIASAALLLAGYLRVVLVLGPIIGTGVWGLSASLETGDAVPTALYVGSFWVAGLSLGGACLYAAVHMLRAVQALFAARAELAFEAVARERQRVARDLHDVLGQTLTAVTLKGDLALAMLRTDATAADRELRSITRLARAGVTGMREVTDGSHRAALDAELRAARSLLMAASVSSHVDVTLPALPARTDEALAWALREGVTNLLRHSRASRCTILGRLDDHGAVLEIVNDGVTGQRGDGHGLTGVAERVAQLGGDVSAHIERDHHRLAVRVPVKVEP